VVDPAPVCVVVAAEELVAPSDVEVVLPGAVVDVVAPAVVEVDSWRRVVEVVVCSAGFTVVAVVGDTETDTGIWAAGVVRTAR